MNLEEEKKDHKSFLKKILLYLLIIVLTGALVYGAFIWFAITLLLDTGG